jgi:S1-C subfamily serine protease
MLANNQWGRGSGIIIDDGIILTCEHVIHPFGPNVQEIFIVKKGELPKKAELVKFDNGHDLAIIRCEGLTIEGTLKTQS